MRVIAGRRTRSRFAPDERCRGCGEADPKHHPGTARPPELVTVPHSHGRWAQVFGALGPVFYGALIGTGSNPTGLFIGYVVGGAIMVLGGIVELLIGINAEGKSLETVTKPLTSTDELTPDAPPATSSA